MKLQTIKQRIVVTQFQGCDQAEKILGYCTIERQFKIFDDGNCRLNPNFQERLIEVDGTSTNLNWSIGILQEFFPGFTGVRGVS